jgi:hypothetical protein
LGRRETGKEEQSEAGPDDDIETRMGRHMSLVLIGRARARNAPAVQITESKPDAGALESSKAAVRRCVAEVRAAALSLQLSK